MNNLIIGGQVSFVANQLKVIVNLADSFTTTGSNFLSNNANVSTGSWQVLDQGADTNFRYGYFCNLDATSSCQVAINSTGSYSIWLQPGDVSILPNSGSCVLYARAYGINPTIVLQYLITEQ